MRELDDWLEGYLAYTDNSEPPEMYRLWTAISVIAAALQRKVVLKWGTLKFYSNMYVVLVGPPGKARKGTAMGPGLSLLQELGVKLAAESITREALIRELAKANDTIIDTKTGQPIFHSSLTVYSQELTVFLGHQNYQLMMDLADWFDCRDEWTYRTKNMGEDEITGVWVNLIGATTPELIRTTLPMNAIGSGLTSRMIFVYEPRKGKVCPEPFLTDKEIALHNALISDLQRIHLLQGEYRITKDFLGLWREWYVGQDDNPPFEDQRFAGYFERRAAHAMKLSLIVNASRTDDLILDKVDLERAINILERTERKMPMTFDGVGELSYSNIISNISSEIALRKEIESRSLFAMFYRDVDERTYESIIKSLERIGYIRRTMSAKGDFIIYYTGTRSADDQLVVESTQSKLDEQID